MTYKTKGVVLRTVKYGETSVIVNILTEMFGVQSYLVNGVRATTKKGTGKANLFQPAAILDLIVYHNQLRNLHRIKEFRWGYIYRHIFSDIKKNAVALFMVELLTKCLKQPEPNEDLFQFSEDAFLSLDQGTDTITANFPLFFALHLTGFFGFQISDDYSPTNCLLDLKEGVFVSERPNHPHFLEDKQSAVTAELLKTRQPAELEQIKLNHDFRRNLLFAYETYYGFHVPDFGTMKTLPVLKELLN